MSKPNVKKVGIEIEYTDLRVQNFGKFREYLARRNWSIVHDASVESPCNHLRMSKLPVKGCTINPNINNGIIYDETIGGELVSPILDTTSNHWIKGLDRILSYLKTYGERENTNRGSIHVHINFPKDSKSGHSPALLRKTWLMAGFLENFFFKIGGMGKEHRGKNMDYIYYRPITKKGPQVVSDLNSNYYPALVYEDVLNIKRTPEFYVKCADILNAEGRYHPSRYSWINFYNLKWNERGPNLEFRVFNKTLRLDYIMAIVEVSIKFCEKAYEYDEKELHKLLPSKFVSLDEKTGSGYFKHCLRLLDFDSSSDYTPILEELFFKSPPLEYEDVRVFSHLISRARVFNDTARQEWFPKSLTKEESLKVRNPVYVDIHKLRKMGETIFPEEVG